MMVDVVISLKKGVSDPEGENTKKALNLLGFKNVKEVRSLKIFRISLEEDDEEKAKKQVEEMCEKLLANPVINDYTILLRQDAL
ncbi:MAG: phosphoribosylformylglycinamidine synthase subunit PurS [Candidatus Syntropharchaeia archaeon]